MKIETMRLIYLCMRNDDVSGLYRQRSLEGMVSCYKYIWCIDRQKVFTCIVLINKAWGISVMFYGIGTVVKNIS